MNQPIVIVLLVVMAVLVCWAVAEVRFEGWKKRKRRIILLVVLALAAQLVVMRFIRGG